MTRPTIEQTRWEPADRLAAYQQLLRLLFGGEADR